jgi:hypothetical protein
MLAERLGGSISANCSLGNGCCFKVILPKGQSESINIEVSGSFYGTKKQSAGAQSKKVLYIADFHLSLVEQKLKTGLPYW